MSDPILQVSNLRKSFGAVVASDGVNLDIRQGEIHAVIGPNGAGKSTLIAQLCGQMPSDEGRVVYDGQDITHLPETERPKRGMIRSFQITSVFPEFTALENVSMAVQSLQGHSFRFWTDARSDHSLTDQAMTHLKTVGLEGEANKPVQELAHGQQRQVELAIALAMQPKLLILDEPMAGMGRAESALVVDILKSLKSKVSKLLVEHDMDAVFSLADRISVLVYGKIIATGTPDEIRANPDVREAYLGGGG
ncbi:MAG: ABC transporter ATP-binding protein [Paracoccaceae bacterium]